ncbi:glycosyl hydrolase family 18 protein [Tenacibaculum salmonis]|uniref:glycosyl hydrolase family 18 protein n=1 Tax=Tenacibaculum sp. P3-BQ1 TaxID=3232310 RepID=UPI0034DFC708
MQKKVIGYFNNWTPLEEVQNKYEGYTDLLFSFWQDPETSVTGAAEEVLKTPEILEFLKSKNKKCILATGGKYFYPLNYEAVNYGTALANFAIQHKFDGVNLDIKNIAITSQVIQWLIDVTITVHQISNEKNYPLEIYHTPQATLFMANEGYSEIEKKTNGIINYYNIQYYNQGEWEYQSYEDYTSLFEEMYNNIENPTAILSIIRQGIPANKLIVGKPITTDDVNNTGYISLENFEDILSTAITNKIPFGGVMGWKVDSDINGIWGKSIAKTIENSKIENPMKVEI